MTLNQELLILMTYKCSNLGTCLLLKCKITMFYWCWVQSPFPPSKMSLSLSEEIFSFFKISLSLSEEIFSFFSHYRIPHGSGKKSHVQAWTNQRPVFQVTLLTNYLESLEFIHYLGICQYFCKLFIADNIFCLDLEREDTRRGRTRCASSG